MSNFEWSLKEYYESFECEEFKKDFENFEIDLDALADWASKNFKNAENPLEKIETFISMKNTFSKYTKILLFAHLTLSADAKNTTASKVVEQFENILTKMVTPDLLFARFISKIDDIEDLISQSESLKAHKFYILSKKESTKYLLSEDEEVIMSKLKTTGSASWERQKNYLVSMLMVDMEENGVMKQFPLAHIRNLAYEADADLRKRAYEAELKAYKKIDNALSFSLNSIKGEVITTTKLKGYASPLERTLIDARMDKETLDAMFEAIKESIPSFRKFFRKKAEMLGHKNGLPFYDLFAPVGEVDMSFTYDEAKAYVVDNFTKFSANLGEFAQKSFANNWVDVLPREGKTGGAFCSTCHAIGESRILTNYGDSFSDVLTLAHELGHGYHSSTLMKETYLNSSYSMPIAETASTMCETILINSALKTATKEEKIVILENDITGFAQVIIDIYSRFLFEDGLFKAREKSSLSVQELNDLMLWAQKEAYGDGLDQNFLHPYMWACKTHYYFPERNYYNFPYAYGALFSKGLYALYLEQGQDFIPLYDKLLNATGKNNLRDVAKIANIEIRDKAFWQSSLKMVEKEIDEFVSL